MAKQLYLIKEGEISLKGLNRAFFEKRLKNNIKDKLRPYHSSAERQKGRLFLHVDEDCPAQQIERALSTTFGIVGWARAIMCEKDPEVIRKQAAALIQGSGERNWKTFKVAAKREDKSFPVHSYDLACMIAEVIHEIRPELTVDLRNPDLVFHIEIRNQAFMYTDSGRGPGGLPAGTAGRGLLLLSGGIDSPVAGFEMAKRGLKLDCLYFHAYPYTSDEALEKVKTLASKIAPYLNGTRLFVVPFTQGQLNIRQKAMEDATTLMFRASMMKLASQVVSTEGMQCIVTGEALSQVASQTLAAMSFTDSMADYLVLRPLVGFDKEEIISVARHIDTYETSILPYEDCCVIFSPKHPVTNPDKAVMKEHYESLGMQEFIDGALKETKIYSYNARGEETGVWSFASHLDRNRAEKEEN